MSLQRAAVLLLGVILIISVVQIGKVDGVRLCGKRLADLLNFVCERHGGFHTPRDRRAVASRLAHKRSMIEILRPLTRRTDPGATTEGSQGNSGNEEKIYTFQSGIVDECCKKSCTVATLISYCANAQQVGNTNLEELFPSDSDEASNISEEELSELEIQQITSTSEGNSNEVAASENEDSNRPNLGLSNRNRPVFIVLSQAQEEEGSAGEYRF